MHRYRPSSVEDGERSEVGDLGKDQQRCVGDAALAA
jgi:hypothetical protein